MARAHELRHDLSADERALLDVLVAGRRMADEAIGLLEDICALADPCARCTAAARSCSCHPRGDD